MEYRASKAWHFSHELATEIHELVADVVETDKVAVELARRMRRASAEAPAYIRASLRKELHHEKLACYMAARNSLEDVHRHLKYSLKLNYIDKDYFKKLEKKAESAYRELGGIIESTEKTIAKLEVE